MKKPDERAKELHSKIRNTIARNQTTIAVGVTENEQTIVGTSDKIMQRDVINALEQNEIVAACQFGKHAEEDVIDEADNRNLTITEIGASRNICNECEDLLKSRNIKTSTPFSGKKSKNRE